MLDFKTLTTAEVFNRPYRHLVARNVISPINAQAIRADYPEIDAAGYIALNNLRPEGAFEKLVMDLMSPQLADILSEKLDLDLAGKPRMITVLRESHIKMGRIHTDSESKICTMLVYLNKSWEEEAGGAVRVLNSGQDINDFVREIPPVEGRVFAFRRADNSWHGHTPFKGSRYVVQTTFLIDETELDRKNSRGRFQAMLKKLNPFG